VKIGVRLQSGHCPPVSRPAYLFWWVLPTLCTVAPGLSFVLTGFDLRPDEGNKFVFVAFNAESGNFIRAQLFSVNDSDLLRPEADAASRHGLVGSGDTDWVDRHVGSTNQRDESGFEFADVAVVAPRSFRKEADQETIVHSLQCHSDRSSTGGVSVDRHHVGAAQYPSDDRYSKQRVPREVADGALHSECNERWVEEALMVDQNEAAAVHRDVLKSANLEPQPEHKDDPHDVLQGQPDNVAASWMGRRIGRWAHSRKRKVRRREEVQTDELIPGEPSSRE